MIVCKCRNINDETPNWEKLVMQPDINCGICQANLMVDEDAVADEYEKFVSSSDLIDNFLEEGGNE